jgi:hypothetical protein
MFLMVGWSALGIAAFWPAAFALDRHNRAARLTALRGAWGCAPVRNRDMVAIAATAPFLTTLRVDARRLSRLRRIASWGAGTPRRHSPGISPGFSSSI